MKQADLCLSGREVDRIASDPVCEQGTETDVVDWLRR